MTRKDDPVFNVRFVQLVEAHPCLWNSSLPAYSKKEEIQKAWQSVANETNDSVRNSRERWRTIRSSFLRSLKLARTTTGRGKRKYYLSKYLQFLVPYTKTRLRNGVTIAALHKTRPPIATTTATTPPPAPLLTTTIASSSSTPPLPLPPHSASTGLTRSLHTPIPPTSASEDTKDSSGIESRVYVGGALDDDDEEEDGEYEEDDEEEEESLALALAEDDFGEERRMGEVEAEAEAVEELEAEEEAAEVHLQRLAAIKREPGCGGNSNDNSSSCHYNNHSHSHSHSHSYSHSNKNNNSKHNLGNVSQHLATTITPRTTLHNDNHNYSNNNINHPYNSHNNQHYNNNNNSHNNNSHNNRNNNNSNNNRLSTSLYASHHHSNLNLNPPHHHHHHQQLQHQHQHQRSSSNHNNNNNNNNGNNNGNNGNHSNSSSVDLAEFAEWIKSKNAHQRHCLMPPPDADQSFLNSLHPFLREMSGRQNRRFRQKVVALIDAVLENAD